MPWPFPAHALRRPWEHSQTARPRTTEPTDHTWLPAVVNELATDLASVQTYLETGIVKFAALARSGMLKLGGCDRGGARYGVVALARFERATSGSVRLWPNENGDSDIGGAWRTRSPSGEEPKEAGHASDGDGEFPANGTELSSYSQTWRRHSADSTQNNSLCRRSNENENHAWIWTSRSDVLTVNRTHDKVARKLINKNNWKLCKKTEAPKLIFCTSQSWPASWHTCLSP